MDTSRKRILIVEDQRLIAVDIEKMLREIGYDVVAKVGSGDEAVAKATEIHPDLILMDIRLDGDTDGIQAAALIRARIDVPIVYVTAFADDETIRRAKATSPFGYLLKPFDERELLAAIEVAIYKHETDRVLADERARRRMAEEFMQERERLIEELKEAVRARDEFIQIASHELRTPLGPLQLQLDMFSETLERQGVGGHRIKDMLDIATRQTVRLTRLIDSMLDVSRITAGRVTLEVERIEVGELVRDVVDRFRDTAQKTGSEIKVLGRKTARVRWDRLRVEQILSNLLGNAIRYGSGKPIRLETRLEGDTVHLSITDQGIGIEHEAMDRIFDRYERAASLRNFGGLGLGLYIARQLAHAHGGSIRVQSKPGAGSTFTLMMPLEATPPSRASEGARVV